MYKTSGTWVIMLPKVSLKIGSPVASAHTTKLQTLRAGREDKRIYLINKKINGVRNQLLPDLFFNYDLDAFGL